jgi:ornithine cyclodeaminase/alanine dehydrogenase-like protein (mu-crystallin family)
LLRLGDLRRGTFVAAVGADSPGKQELDAALLASAIVVTDLTRQCADAGELHHALAAGLMTMNDVRAELGEVLSGHADGRRDDDEIVVFDSTGTGFEDAAAAQLVLRQLALAPC